MEVAGIPKLLPACTTKVREGWVVHTDSERLRNYRKMTLELLFAERNHVCAVCVANGHCELQTLAYSLGMDHVRYDYCYPEVGHGPHPPAVRDGPQPLHPLRPLRARPAGTSRAPAPRTSPAAAARSHIITDMNEPWGDSETCTSCGKCVQSCPTGALFQMRCDGR